MGTIISVTMIPQMSCRPGNLYLDMTYDAIAAVNRLIVGRRTDSHSELNSMRKRLVPFTESRSNALI